MNLVTLQTYKNQIISIVNSHHASNARVFGSVLHGKETATSDVDLLIEPTKETSLMDIGAIRYELKALLGVSVDILTPKSLPNSYREKVLIEALAL